MHVREARVNARHTQEQVAGAIRVSPTRYLHIERGDRKPTPEIREAIKQFFGDPEISFGQPPRGLPSKVRKFLPIPAGGDALPVANGTTSHDDPSCSSCRPAGESKVGKAVGLRTAIDLIVEALGEREALDRLLKRHATS